ncbi:EF-P lysine aminoacylase EpmA [Oceanospirillum sediminis]|uniref:EF-P lysine aminoacylase GenX n=1 Tax=Oceanospirillum sediminis TaxID=2760088 RepID=A0A839ISG0_9GAMM|nr:EF-P lysine aminoacylase EpmA [Oceanospirillum sediminis]MBB1488403.1 EF-P lysine aminoacylase GenX [Oceanospirillum sediminis]
MNKLWQPSAPIENLRLRAETLNQVRQFFYDRHILEVETPILGRGGSTDPYLDSMITVCSGGGMSESVTLYLQTSPEFHMKRLLAAGSGPIWQLSRSFRNGEASKRHNPEFSMLEWYRPDFNLQRLMAEVQELLEVVLGEKAVGFSRYRDLFRTHLAIDPFDTSLDELRCHATDYAGINASDLDRESCCDLLMSHVIEPELGQEGFTFVYEYPAAQAALARLKSDQEGDLVADRFECYYQGLELANGYHELCDPREQKERFSQDNKIRRQLGKSTVQEDILLLEALHSGLPDCSGVALGFDRLLMLRAGITDISEILSFDMNRA